MSFLFHPLFFASLLLLGPITASAQEQWRLRHEDKTSGDVLRSVIEGAAGVVAVGDGGAILHSTDARNWTSRASGTGAGLAAVAYGAGRYVAVGDQGLILTSSDAVAWGSAASGTRQRLNQVRYAQDKFVAVGDGGALLASLDGGTTWRTLDSPADDTRLRGLAFGGGHWIATGENGGVIHSADGLNWTRQGGTPKQDIAAVAFTETYTESHGTYGYTYLHFLALGANGAMQVYYFSLFNLGDNPAARTSYSTYATARPATKARLNSLEMVNKVLIATGEDGTAFAASSHYGPWRRIAIDTDRSFAAAGSFQGTLLLVGEKRTIFQSEPTRLSRRDSYARPGGSTSEKATAKRVAEAPPTPP